MLYELGFNDTVRQEIHDDLLRAEERERIASLMRLKMCLNYLDDGSCDHQLCWGLADLINNMLKEDK